MLSVVVTVFLQEECNAYAGLTGKPYSAKLNPSKEQLYELGQKYGKDFEKWWREHFGHAFNCLTQSEARYLARSPDVDTIRDRLAAAECKGDRAGDAESLREQRRRIRKLKSYRPPVPSVWTSPSCVLASVTPVVLNRHFDSKHRWERAAEGAD